MGVGVGNGREVGGLRADNALSHRHRCLETKARSSFMTIYLSITRRTTSVFVIKPAGGVRVPLSHPRVSACLSLSPRSRRCSSACPQARAGRSSRGLSAPRCGGLQKPDGISSARAALHTPRQVPLVSCFCLFHQSPPTSGEPCAAPRCVLYPALRTGDKTAMR